MEITSDDSSCVIEMSTAMTKQRTDGTFIEASSSDQRPMPQTTSRVSIWDSGTLPIILKFEDVEYSVALNYTGSRNPIRGAVSSIAVKHKQVLKGITGSIYPGEILALMGPSGSGKTTLLKTLGGRLHGYIRGKVTYNEVPYSSATKRRIGFVTQDDVLFPQLTVEETLVFAAFLRLPSNMSRRQKMTRAETIIRELGLERCRHTRIGGALVKGVSGGERKRTSIGYEILVDPSLLLLDEPTSGLDSTSANKLLQLLQCLANGGRTIITTIHQPSSRVYHMFDKLLLISEGYPIYFGLATDAMNYFSSIGFVPQLAMNPADFMLDLATGYTNGISIPQSLISSQSSEKFEFMVIKYLQVKYKSELEMKEKEANHKCITASKRHQQAVLQIKNDWKISGWEQFVIVGKRTYRERCMDYFDLLRLLQAIGVAVLLGLLWWKSKFVNEAQLRDQVGLLFYICIFWTSSSMFGAVYVFPFEKAFLVKDRKSDMYPLSIYYICSTLCDMVAHVCYPTIFMGIMYFMVGFRRTVTCFFFTLLSILLIVITSQGAGELFGAATLSIKRAGVIASLVLMLFLLTGGYYVQHIPKFMQWLKYVSFMHYGFRLLLKVQYSGNLLYDCKSATGCKKLQSSPSFDGIILNDDIQEVWILLCMTLAYRLGAYACLRRRISASNI